MIIQKLMFRPEEKIPEEKIKPITYKLGLNDNVGLKDNGFNGTQELVDGITRFIEMQGNVRSDRRRMLYLDVDPARAFFVAWEARKTEKEVRSHIVQTEIGFGTNAAVFDIEMLARFAGPESVRKLKQDILKLLEDENESADDYVERLLRTLKFADEKVPGGVEWADLAIKFKVDVREPFRPTEAEQKELKTLESTIAKYGPPNIVSDDGNMALISILARMEYNSFRDPPIKPLFGYEKISGLTLNLTPND